MLASAQSDAGPSRRVLVADDDYHERELIAGILIQSGYQVDTANDGLDAWAMLDDGDYDLLITDNQMPRMSGMKLILKLRSQKRRFPSSSPRAPCRWTN